MQFPIPESHSNEGQGGCGEGAESFLTLCSGDSKDSSGWLRWCFLSQGILMHPKCAATSALAWQPVVIWEAVRDGLSGSAILGLSLRSRGSQPFAYVCCIQGYPTPSPCVGRACVYSAWHCSMMLCVLYSVVLYIMWHMVCLLFVQCVMCSV